MLIFDESPTPKNNPSNLGRWEGLAGGGTSKITGVGSLPPCDGNKWQRFLCLFVNGARLNYQSARRFGTSCLHSDVSELQNRRGIKIQSRWITLRGWKGANVQAKEYWLDPDPENVARARQLLGWK